MERIRSVATVLVAAARRFGPDRAGRMAAAISYRVVFAIAPLLIVAVGVAGLVLGSSDDARQRLLEEIEKAAGSEFAEIFADFVEPALDFGSATALVGFVLLLWLISSLFLEVQRDLDDIFEVPYEYVAGIVPLARQRGVGALWSIGLGLSLLIVLLLNSLWRFLGGLFPDDLSGFHAAISIITPLVSFAVLPLIFGLVLQTMTSVKLPWRPVWWGATFISISFLAASYGIGWYFQLFGAPTAIGFASSLVVVLFLAYVLSTVFLFGAEVTRSLIVFASDDEDDPNPDPDMLVADPPTPVPQAAVMGFLSGLFVGWRRSSK